MAATIPDQFKDIAQKVAYAHLATLMADGRPQVTPVWFDLDGDDFRVNSAKGRVKDKNMRRNKDVALSIQDPDNAYRYLAIQGKVVEITETAPTRISIPGEEISGQRQVSVRRPGEVRVIYRSARRRFPPWVKGLVQSSRFKVQTPFAVKVYRFKSRLAFL